MDNIDLSPSLDYPYTYTPLNPQEMAQKLQEFNAVNSFESLKLDEYGMLCGNIPVDLSAGLDSLIVKNLISQTIKTYAPFLGITNSDSIDVESDIYITFGSHNSLGLNKYFRLKLKFLSSFKLDQYKLTDRPIEYAGISFYFSPTENQMTISGRWYPKAYFPERVIKNQDIALRNSIQFIKENHKEVTSLNLSNIKKEEFRKVIFPYVTEKGIEMRECWEVIFWSNTIETLVDTQTGEVIYYLEYGYMI